MSFVEVTAAEVIALTALKDSDPKTRTMIKAYLSR
jgi:hypothetical protein